MMTPPGRARVLGPVITPWSEEMAGMRQAAATAPTTGTWTTANRAVFLPVYLPEPFVVAKAFWCNGTPIGSGDAIDMGIYAMTDMTTGRCDLLRSTGPVYSAGAISVVQEAGWPQCVVRNVIATGSTTDGTSFTTAVVAMSVGKLYLLTVENSHGTSAVAVSSIDNGPTFTSRGTTQFNTNLNRVTILSAVPASNYTGTLVINFGGGNTQTGCLWSLEEVSGVDTTTNDGVVQAVTATGSGVAPTVTLAAFGSSYNATYFMNGNVGSTTAPKSGFQELSDITVATPSQFQETQWAAQNDTAPSGAIGSFAWGAIGIEIKAQASVPSQPWRIARANITASFSDSDATSYTTASVTMKAGRLYLMAVENTKASAADAVTSITGGGTWTSRSTTTFDTSTAKRISIWSCVPTTDYTGTIVISFGANTETSCIWSLNEFSGVDTTTNDGIVQNATNTGNTANPSVSLSAFGSVANSTFQAAASVNSAAHTVGTGMTQLSTTASTAPAARMSAEVRVDDVRNPGTTVTSSQWGACAVEIKADTSPLIIPASLPGNPNVYMAMSMSGVTAQVLRFLPSLYVFRSAGCQALTNTFPLPSTCVPTIPVNATFPLAGFSSRSLIG